MRRSIPSATNSGTNVATNNPNVATDHLADNKRIVDEIVKKKIHSKMAPELATLLNKVPAHL